MKPSQYLKVLLIFLSTDCFANEAVLNASCRAISAKLAGRTVQKPFLRTLEEFIKEVESEEAIKNGETIGYNTPLQLRKKISFTDVSGAEWTYKIERGSTIYKGQDQSTEEIINVNVASKCNQEEKNLFDGKQSRSISIKRDPSGEVKSWSLTLHKIEGKGDVRWVQPKTLKAEMVEGKGTPAMVFGELLMLQEAGLAKLGATPEKLEQIEIGTLNNERSWLELTQIMHEKGFKGKQLEDLENKDQKGVMNLWLNKAAGFNYIRGMLNQMGLEIDPTKIRYSAGDTDISISKTPKELASNYPLLTKLAEDLEKESPGHKIYMGGSLNFGVRPISPASISPTVNKPLLTSPFAK